MKGSAITNEEIFKVIHSVTPVRFTAFQKASMQNIP